MSSVVSDSPAIEAHREGAEIYSGDPALCRRKSIEIFREFHLPAGIVPVDLEEVGLNRSTGFFWLKLKKKSEHTFKKIGRLVSYAVEVTSFVEDRRMKKVTGVKSKELLIWLSLVEMSIDTKDPEKMVCKSSSGLYRTFPVSAFEIEGADMEVKSDLEKMVGTGSKVEA